MEVNHNKIARTARVVLERNSKGVKSKVALYIFAGGRIWGSRCLF